MTTPPEVPGGWIRLLVRSKLAVGRDFRVLDPDTDEQRYLVDGKLSLLGAKAEVHDAAGRVLLRLASQPLDLAKRFTITGPGGEPVAEIRGKRFSPIRERMTLTTATGATWEVAGSLLEKDYAVTAPTGPVARISQKWLALRDTYAVDVAAGTDPALVLAVLWCVDHWVEQRDR
ncbi:LURP-one-related/scramblase family protein [Aquipuribacter sp. SD81]|uniref:LURP-one-related/scramblase family protein n=1 Tax=Aquipuribacter sp. SD81 TaxID=3127703 RepID=UPI003015973A